MGFQIDGVDVTGVEFNGIANVTEVQFDGVKVWPSGPIISDKFSVDLFTGQNQTVTNGIDASTGVVCVWQKGLNTTENHRVMDSTRGGGVYSASNSNVSQITEVNRITSFNNNGYTCGNPYGASEDIVSWMFKKAVGFVDIINYTGDGTSGRLLPHMLGVQAGLVLTDILSSSAINWGTQHVSRGGLVRMRLDNDDAEQVQDTWDDTAMTDTDVILGSSAVVNQNGQNYFSLVFADDTSANGIIRCGEFDASGGNTFVDLSWPESIQYIMVKAVGVGDWEIYDTTRGITKKLIANDTDIEITDSNVVATAGGFTWSTNESVTYTFMCIRAE